jgi:hypothetical protein
MLLGKESRLGGAVNSRAAAACFDQLGSSQLHRILAIAAESAS